MYIFLPELPLSSPKLPTHIMTYGQTVLRYTHLVKIHMIYVHRLYMTQTVWWICFLEDAITINDHYVSHHQPVMMYKSIPRTKIHTLSKEGWRTKGRKKGMKGRKEHGTTHWMCSELFKPPATCNIHSWLEKSHLHKSWPLLLLQKHNWNSSLVIDMTSFVPPFWIHTRCYEG